MTLEQLANTEQSRLVAIVVCIASLIPIAVLGGLVADGSLIGGARLVGLALLFSLLVSAWLGARRLLTPRGGLWLDKPGRRIGLGMTSIHDVWWLSLDALIGVETERHLVSSDVSDFGWRTCLVLRDHTRVVLVETLERDLAEALAEDVATRTGLSLLDAANESEARRPCEPGAQRFAVNRGGASQTLLTWMGLTALLFGAGLYSQVDKAPVLGFMLAPVFLLFGGALSGIVVFKRLGYEELKHRGGLWTHRYVLGSLSWGEKSVSAPQPRWLVYIQPARGARLELHGEDGALVMANGATTGSSLNVQELMALVGRFT